MKPSKHPKTAKKAATIAKKAATIAEKATKKKDGPTSPKMKQASASPTVQQKKKLPGPLIKQQPSKSASISSKSKQNKSNGSLASGAVKAGVKAVKANGARSVSAPPLAKAVVSS